MLHRAAGGQPLGANAASDSSAAVRLPRRDEVGAVRGNIEIVRVGDVLIQAVQWNPRGKEAFDEGQQVGIELPGSNVQLLAVE